MEKMYFKMVFVMRLGGSQEVVKETLDGDLEAMVDSIVNQLDDEQTRFMALEDIHGVLHLFESREVVYLNISRCE